MKEIFEILFVKVLNMEVSIEPEKIVTAKRANLVEGMNF